VSAKQRFGVEVSIAELLAQGKEAVWGGFFEAAFEVLSRLIVAGVEHEMDEFVGARWHERQAAGRRTYRAGRRPRRFTVLGRDVMLRVPRARTAGFRSTFLDYRKRRHQDFDEGVVELYVAGTSMRETTAVLYEMFGTSVSPTTVSTLVRQLDAERKAFQSRRVPDAYRYLVFDGMYVRCQVAPSAKLRGAKEGRRVEKVAVLLVRGIQADGTRELVDFRVAEEEKEAAWESLLADLFARGLEGAGTRCFVHDGSDGLEAAIASVYGPRPHQRCICHKLGNVWDAVEDKEAHGELRKDAAAVYDVREAEAAWDRLAAWRAKWRGREPAAVATLCRDFASTLTFLSVPRAHRRWIATTNPVERYIREVRRRTRPMGTFQSLGSCRRLVYVAVRKLSHERRNAIPYSLWTSQPWYGTRRRRPPRQARPDVSALRKELRLALRNWYIF
jgi:transposase-like protein